MTNRRDILDTAKELIDGDRARTYGPPEVGFQRTADLWTAMGFRMEGRPLNAVDVSLALTQLKVSRIIGQPDHEDSWIDAPGYLALGGEIALKPRTIADFNAERDFERFAATPPPLPVCDVHGPLRGSSAGMTQDQVVAEHIEQKHKDL